MTIKISIVGKQAVPISKRKKWLWLYKEFDKVKDGQAVRVVIPIIPEFPRSSPQSAWKRYCKLKGRKGHMLMETQDKFRVHYFWYD